MRYWILEYDSPVNDEEWHEPFPDDETACDDRVTLSLERDSFSPQKIFPVSEEVFALTAELCSINFSLIISLVMEALVDTVIHFFDTELSLLLCFSGVEVKRMEVVIVTSLCYSCKTLKTSWMNDIVRVKKDKLTVTKDSNESMLHGIKQKSMTRISRLAGINRRNYGIEIKLKSGRGIKELFWGPPYELLLRWKVIRIPISHSIKQKEIVGRVF